MNASKSRPRAARFLLIAGLLLLVMGGLFVVIRTLRRPALETLVEQATRSCEEGDYEAARVHCRNVLSRDQGNAAANALMGRMWFEEGAPLPALHHLLKVRAASPDDLASGRRIAAVYRSLGQFHEAHEEALAVVKRDPRDVATLVLLVETAQTADEVRETEEVLNNHPDRESLAFHLASASLLLKRGRLTETKRELDAAAKANRRAPEVHLALAHWHVINGDLAAAMAAFRTAAELAPPLSPAKRKYAEFLLRNGDPGEAERYLKTLTDSHPGNLPAWRLRARLALREKRYDAALDMLQHVTSKDVGDFESMVLEAEVLAKQGEIEKAEAKLQRVDEIYAKVPMIKYQLARVYLGNGKVSKAVTALEQAVALSPGLTDAVLLLAELRLRQGDAATAAANLALLVEQQPALTDARVLLARALRSQGRFDQAVATIREAISQTPGRGQLHFMLGLMLREQDKAAEARAEFSRAAELDPNDLLSVFQLVEIDLATGRPDAAMQVIDAVVEHRPDSAEAHYFRAKVLAARRDWDGVAASLDQALKLQPDFFSALELSVETALERHDAAAAQRQLAAVLEHHPDNPRALMLAGRTYEGQGDFTKAREAYERVLAADPKSTAALNNLAWLLATRFEELDKAHQLARQARELAPDQTAAIDTLGWINYLRGDYPAALALFRQCARSAPDNPEFRYHLGATCYMLGNATEAAKELERAVAGTASFAGKNDVQWRLEVLRAVGDPAAGLDSEMFGKLLREHPDDPVVVLRLGALLQQADRAEEARDAYAKALKLSPQMVPAMVALSRLYSGPLDDTEQALACAKDAYKLALEDPEVIAALGRAVYRSGDFVWAHSLLQGAARRQEPSPELLYSLALAAYGCGEVAEADEHLQQLVGGSPEAPLAAAARSLRGTIAINRDPRDAGSGEFVQQRLAADPHDPPALVATACLQRQQGKLHEAQRLLEDTLRQHPNLVPARLQLAALLAADPAQLEQAFKLANDLHRASLDNLAAAKLLAELHYRRAEYPDAIELLDACARRRPLDPRSLFHLGMSQVRNGQAEAGRATLGKALADELPDELATEARQALAEPSQPSAAPDSRLFPPDS